MKQSVRLGRVAGVPVGVHWSVVVILAIFAETLAVSVLPAEVPHRPTAAYWLVGCVAAVLLVGALLAHELAHALVARGCGVGVRSITLWGLGGVSELDTDPPNAGADLRIALAGPAASLIVGAVFFGVAVAVGQAGGPRLLVATAAWLGLMNGVLAVFNLLPGAPLDGGRVLRAVLWRRYRDRDRAAVTAARSGRYLGAVLTGLGVVELAMGGFAGGLWLILIGWFLISAAAAEEAAARSSAALRGLCVADVMTPDPEIAPGWLTVAEFASRVAADGMRQRAYPVLCADARLAGVVVTAQLVKFSPQERACRRIEQIALPVPERYLAAPGDPAVRLATHSPLGGEVIAIVLEHHRIAGMVTVADLRQAMLWRGLPTGSFQLRVSGVSLWADGGHGSKVPSEGPLPLLSPAGTCWHEVGYLLPEEGQ